MRVCLLVIILIIYFVLGQHTVRERKNEEKRNDGDDDGEVGKEKAVLILSSIIRWVVYEQIHGEKFKQALEFNNYTQN